MTESSTVEREPAIFFRPWVALAASGVLLVLVAALTVVVGSDHRLGIIGSVIAGIHIVVMAWSRTELGVHWLTDVVAGVALGSSLTLGAFAVAGLVGTRGRAPGEPVPIAAVRR